MIESINSIDFYTFTMFAMMAFIGVFVWLGTREDKPKKSKK